MSSTSSPTPAELSDENNSGSLIAITILFIVLLFIFATLRVVSMRIKKRPFELHDFFSYLAFFFNLGECALSFIFVYWAGCGYHAAYLEKVAPWNIKRDFLFKFPIQLIYISTFTVAKLSIILLYRKIFVTRVQRWTINFLLLIVFLTWLGEFLSAIFQCQPISYAWDFSVQGTCVNQVALQEYWSVPNIVTDLVILTLPMPIVWRLNTSKGQKVGLTVTFLLGGSGLVFCIVRFVAFFNNNNLSDPTWDSSILQIWTIVETGLYYIAGVLPTLRPLGVVFWQRTSPYFTRLSQRSTALPGGGGSSSSGGGGGGGRKLDWLRPLGSGRHYRDATVLDTLHTDGSRWSVLAKTESRSTTANPSLDKGGITRTQMYGVAYEAV